MQKVCAQCANEPPGVHLSMSLYKPGQEWTFCPAGRINFDFQFDWLLPAQSEQRIEWCLNHFGYLGDWGVGEPGGVVLPTRQGAKHKSLFG